MEKIATHVNIDKDLLEWVREQAKLRRCSISQVFRTLIIEGMQREKKAEG